MNFFDARAQEIRDGKVQIDAGPLGDLAGRLVMLSFSHSATLTPHTLLARANPDTSIVIDNFVELDRGYCSCWGLVDRLYNPKDGSRVVTILNTLLPQRLQNLTSQETTGGRVLSAECGDGMALLISPHSSPAANELNDHFPDEIANKQGTLIGLVNGKEMGTNLREVIAKRAGAETTQSPALLLLND